MVNNSLDTLIVVVGHGICMNPEAPNNESSWVGIYPNQARLLYAHCAAGVAEAANNPTSLLVFSGGATRPQSGGLSEAESYRNIAETAQWWGKFDVASRSCLEPLAQDSLGNLVLSLAVFRNAVGHYPTRTIVCGFAFKQERFYLHANAIRLPGEFIYRGINNPSQQDGTLKAAIQGEACKRHALQEDPFLCADAWQEQRRLRNPFDQPPPFFPKMPKLQRFLDYLYNNGEPAKPVWLD